MLRKLALSFALLPSLAQAAPIVIQRPPPQFTHAMDVTYPSPAPNCREVRGAFSEWGREYLVEDATVCWEPASPNVVRSESLTVWSPDVGAYTYTVDRFGEHVNTGQIVARFTDANGVAAAPQTGDFRISTHHPAFLADPEINIRFAAQLQKASYFDATVAALPNGKVTSPIAIKLASKRMTVWVDLLGYIGWEPVQIHGGGTSGNQVHCFSGVDSDTCGDGVGDTSPGPDGVGDSYDEGEKQGTGLVAGKP